MGHDFKGFVPRENQNTRLDEEEITKLFHDIADDYAVCYDQLLELNGIFRRAIAATLEPRLQAHLAAIPQPSADAPHLIHWESAGLLSYNGATR